MHFDEDKLTASARRLQERWPSPRTCPVCRQNPDHWRISETPVLLPLLVGSAELDVRDLREAAGHLSAAPAVALTCSTCGHILLFSAAEMDVVPMKDPSRPRFSLPSE